MTSPADYEARRLRAALYHHKVMRRNERKGQRMNRFVSRCFLFSLVFFLWAITLACVVTVK